MRYGTGIKDIARAAGVSPSTVSRVLGHDDPRYAVATRQRVRAVAEQLGYRPSALARSLASGTTCTAGVMVPSGDFYGPIVEGINEVLLRHGHVMLHTWHPATNVQQPDDPLERTIIHHLVDRQVDGIILRPGSEEYEASYFAEIWQHGMPLILIDREMRMFAADFVGTDDVAVGAEAARLLTTLGHRRLLFTGGGENVSTSRWREQGFRHVLSELPDAACRSITLGPGDDDVTRLTGILAAADRPTAVFCYNDTNALPLYAAARQARLRIPQDLSVVGCGAVHCGALLDPPLTTFDQVPRQIGRRAAELYLERVGTPAPRSPPRQVRLPASLVRRASEARRA